MNGTRDTAQANAALLQRVIRDLEQSDERNHPSHRRAVQALLAEGPLRCKHSLRREITHLRETEQPPPEISLWRAELIQFLRDTVRLHGFGLDWYGIGLHGPVMLQAAAARHRVTGAVEGSTRDSAVLQLFLLMLQVGLGNIRRCGAAEPQGCKRLFVKTCQREFCSARCQHRDYKRKLRQRTREQKARARRRRIAKGTGPVRIDVTTTTRTVPAPFRLRTKGTR